MPMLNFSASQLFLGTKDKTSGTIKQQLCAMAPRAPERKSDRLHKVLEFVSTVHDLCLVLGLDFLCTVTEVHPILDEENGVQTKSITDETLSMLAKTVLTLKEDKMERLKKLQDLSTQLIDLWNLMDTPDEEISSECDAEGGDGAVSTFIVGPVVSA